MMGCCTSFSATSRTMRLDPGRYVNFTTGMVLGAEDYLQGHTYLAERTKRVVRDLHGYGTVAGLEVSVENDGEKGPLVRVTPGSAATPSGQLICVGREQCGGLNQWLATDEVAAVLDARRAATPGETVIRLPIWLVLCYRDCAVAPVPVPGEPCRSDEELMVPSRIADDYALSFAFDPPEMTEAIAIARFNAWMNSLIINEDDTAETGDLADLTDLAIQQLDAIFPTADLDEEPVVPSTLAPLNFVPALAPGFFAAIKRLWITRWRARVMAVACNGVGTAADDCIMLARIDIGVIKPTSRWIIANIETEGEITDIEASKDETDRPLLLAANIDQTPAGIALSGSGPQRQLALIGSDGAAAISNGFITIVGDAPVALSIPAPAAGIRGDTLVITLASATGATITAEGDATIGGDDTFDMTELKEAHLRSNGSDNWAVIRTIARGGG